MYHLPTSKRRALKMKTIVMVFGLLVSTSALGDGLAEMNKAQRCAAWVTNAMHGATQSLRGAAREVQYIPRGTLEKMLSEAGGVARDKIYILTDEGYTEDERTFLETSTLFGYDAMSSWKSRNGDALPARNEWQRQLTATCMEYDVI